MPGTLYPAHQCHAVYLYPSYDTQTKVLKILANRIRLNKMEYRCIKKQNDG